MKSPRDALREIDRAAGADLPLDDVTFDGEEPVLTSKFALATSGAASIAACGLAAAAVWRERTGRAQRVSVKLRDAAAALRSANYLRIDGKPPASPWAAISGFYETRDGRWIQYHCNYPHHRDGVLALLGCDDNKESVQEATGRREAEFLEDALAEAGMCAGIVRTRSEWEGHPQGRAVAQLPLIEVLRIGDSKAEALPSGERPLSGVRVLDLTRVLAGPTGARTLAEHGADVLRVTAAHLPAQPEVDADTGHGKLSARLDLRSAGDHERLLSLVREGDVFVQSYRPGALGARGLSPETLAAVRPGIVYVSLSAYGHEGPWRERRGFDSLVQSVSGFVSEQSLGGKERSEGPPHHLPAQAIDYVSGYLMAFGAMVALLRRAREGGSYHVRVSLAQTGQWIWGLGRGDGAPPADGGAEDVASIMSETNSPIGRLTHLAPVVEMSETPARWERPSVPLDYHPPEWPARA
jgi:crotonobetainyl-CoA:carnitine CoA-transferase CaiB-like acyl-CoA transferase